MPKTSYALREREKKSERDWAKNMVPLKHNLLQLSVINHRIVSMQLLLHEGISKSELGSSSCNVLINHDQYLFESLMLLVSWWCYVFPFTVASHLYWNSTKKCVWYLNLLATRSSVATWVITRSSFSDKTSSSLHQ